MTLRVSYNFDKAYPITLNFEGNHTLTNNSADIGGRTYAGIAEKYNPNWEGWRIIDAGKDPHEEVENYMYNSYWLPLKLDTIGKDAPPELGLVLYDTAVLFGVKRTIQFTQEYLKVDTDGVVGPKTLAAMATVLMYSQSSGKVTDWSRHILFKRLQRHFYVVSKRPKQGVFLKGWVNRVLELQGEVVSGIQPKR